MKTRFNLFLGFAAALLLATSVAALQNADVAGEWLMTITTPQGERNITLNIEQDGSTLTGTSQVEGQEEPSPLTGTIEGNAISLNISMGGRGRGRGGGGGGRGGRGGFAWEGTVDGDTMSGSRTMPGRGGGEGFTMEWKAVRQ